MSDLTHSSFIISMFMHVFSDEILTLHHTGGKKSSMGKGHHEPHFWKGMGNEPHGLTALRYEGIRTKLTPEEMYRVHFQEGLDRMFQIPSVPRAVGLILYIMQIMLRPRSICQRGRRCRARGVVLDRCLGAGMRRGSRSCRMRG